MAATAMANNEEQWGLEHRPRNVSPGTASTGADGDDSAVGAAPFPARTHSPRNSTTIGDHELPNVPDGQLSTETRPPVAPSVHFTTPTAPNPLGHARTNPQLPPLTIGNLRSKRRKASSSSMPPERTRNGQSSHGPTEEQDFATPTKQTVEETDEETEERKYRERQGSFMTRLKALAAPNTPGHTRTTSGMNAIGSAEASLSPRSEQSEPTYPINYDTISPTAPVEHLEAGHEADEEDSEDDEIAGDVRPKQKRRSRRPPVSGIESAPQTPRTSRFATFLREYPIPGSSSRPTVPARRVTVSDMSGVSEDEGKDRLRNAWRRGIEGARGFSVSTRRNIDGDASDAKRPGNLRRLTGFGGVDGTHSPLRQRAERYNNASAQKWRQVKAGLRMLGQRKREERIKVDHQRSAQLMAELLAGSPAALILASMFQRDEHHRRKVPVLLEQLKISILDSHGRTDKKGDRDFIFRVDVEYGNGPARMEWTVFRSIKDFVDLHGGYMAQVATEKVRNLGVDDKSKAKLPRFPKSAIPYARGMRGLFEKVKDEEDEHEANATNGPDNTDRPGQSRSTPRRKSSFALPRRVSTTDIGNTPADPDTLSTRQRQLYAERSRQKLEVYLQQMLRWLIFRPDSTRLCRFLELSAMSIRLSAEGGYQGKQGLLHIATRKHQELHRKTLETFAPKAIKERHKRRWFLVRHSYILCVDGPESLITYDVFLVDSDFAIEKRRKRVRDQESPQQMAKAVTDNATPTKKAHLIRLYNAERKLKLYARTEKEYVQFQESLSHMMQNTVWAQKQRFASFAPVRNNVWARWLVDGRDYMWQVSRAIDNAKDFIYIHGWWLSPELYMRRPAAISQKWRLDRLLQRKAQEGVKIFVIVYRNIESAIPIDSEYTKWSLLDLHENICIQRSPNQFRQNQFFWAHHEKLVIVDNMMAFVGGLDLCFGRWDDPVHTLVDDKLTGFELDPTLPRDSEHCQVWPGKDYSNPRVQDFYALDRPYEEMYDRTKVPRMPWHDISMQLVGQPARDIGRHFVQRWNYILRSRVPSRPTPVLIPPPEYEQAELERLGLTGSCQIQIVRSCAPWSIGTPNKVEHSIMNAYCALIKESEHFVYVENQFFITSCAVEGTTIHNKIGDAIVERAIQAHEKHERWQACLVIPLMPGFQNSVDSQDGTSVRLIMQCQFRSICRGESSIFGRLRAHGMDPEDYVRFYSLRSWGKIGPRKALITEQLYIHAKCMIVDDRTAIIGSANINERSMLGSRDSEVAAIVTDTRMLPSTMGGKPYDVGEFPHTLRMRLMREHLGIDVDAIYQREQVALEREQDAEMEQIYRHDKFVPSQEYFEPPPPTPPATSQPEHLHPGVHPNESNGWAGTTRSASVENVESNGKPSEKAERLRRGLEHDLDVNGSGFDNMKRQVEAGNDGLRDSFVDSLGRETFTRKDAPDVRSPSTTDLPAASGRAGSQSNNLLSPPWPTERHDTGQLGLAPRSQLPELPAHDDTDIGGPAPTHASGQGSGAPMSRVQSGITQQLRRPEVHEDCMKDPLADGFYHDIWHAVAADNTRLFRHVFRCMPDSEVLDWKTYEKFNDHLERFMQSQGLGGGGSVAAGARPAKEAPARSGPPGSERPDLSAPGSFLAAAHHDDAAAGRSKSVFSALVGQLRAGSKASVDSAAPAPGPEMREKDRIESLAAPGTPASGASSVPATVAPAPEHPPLDEKDATLPPPLARDADAASNEKAALKAAEASLPPPSRQQRVQQYSETQHLSPDMPVVSPREAGGSVVSLAHSASQKRRRRTTVGKGANPAAAARPVQDEVLSREEAEAALKLVQGHLVLWPYDWLEKEEKGGNWLYNIDQLAPWEIYD